VRLVAWHAVHDWGEAGFGPADLTMLIEQLSRRMRIYLSCEGHPPRGLEQFVAKVRPDRMHHIMAFARLIVSEGTSMAAEAALMGVPALVVSSLADRIGYMQVLERDYGLVRVFRPGPKAIQEILAVADNLPSPVEVRARRDKLVEGLAYMPDVIEKHIDAVMGKSNG
jgi:predicted glycosyltransferase